MTKKQYSHVLQVVLLKQLAPHNAERKDVRWRPISLETTHFRTPVLPAPLKLNLGVLAQSRRSPAPPCYAVTQTWRCTFSSILHEPLAPETAPSPMRRGFSPGGWAMPNLPAAMLSPHLCLASASPPTNSKAQPGSTSVSIKRNVKSSSSTPLFHGCICKERSLGATRSALPE